MVSVDVGLENMRELQSIAPDVLQYTVCSLSGETAGGVVKVQYGINYRTFSTVVILRHIRECRRLGVKKWGDLECHGSAQRDAYLRRDAARVTRKEITIYLLMLRSGA